MKPKKYSGQTEELIEKVRKQGLNIWAMLGLFKKRSKLRVEIPEEVVESVCQEYLKRGHSLEHSFPYFLQVLKNKSEQYFARQNEEEGYKLKTSPNAFKDILKELLK